MTEDDFLKTMDGDAPPSEWSLPLQALWWDGKGDWEKAHSCAQDASDSDGSWVHAYLHRVEGDLGNAGYWYRRAGKPAHSGALQQEWREIVGHLLAQS
ncbi:hypothetical protein EOI86_24275 [Hwanghaeella grinnelliae]|uniref:Sel1 repeat family protein n=1 Tax=Hwanghaeella grinnelliae TaxID=2500179 RepID=A0A3S2Z5D9_9PROT|nr:hypothetical protein [Hwanghaeella grinnelliae]RVU34228.1 hypothetical protein EOI86_24275 [Hwanghaeella grinnelliae]